MHAVEGVPRFVWAFWHIIVEDVWNAHSDLVSLCNSVIRLLFQFGDLGAKVCDFGEDSLCLDLIASLLCCADSSSRRVFGGSQLIGLVLKINPSLVQLDDFFDVVMREATLVVVLADDVGVVSEQINFKHRASPQNDIPKSKMAEPMKMSPPTT
jgi:hypothetical protein